MKSFIKLLSITLLITAQAAFGAQQSVATGMSIEEIAESVGMSVEQYKNSLVQNSQDGEQKQTQAALDATQFAKEREAKRASAAHNAQAAVDEDTPESILAAAFCNLPGRRGRFADQERIKADLPEEIQLEIGRMFVSTHARQKIKRDTLHVARFKSQLLPAIMTKSYSQRARAQFGDGAHLFELYDNYESSDHNIERAQPIILGGYIVGGELLPSNTTYRDIYTVTDLLGRPLAPSEIACVMYSNNSNPVILSEWDRKSLVALSHEQRKLIVSLFRQELDQRTLGLAHPLTEKEMAIFKTLPVTMQDNLTAYYRLNEIRSQLVQDMDKKYWKFRSWCHANRRTLYRSLFALDVLIVADFFFWNDKLKGSIQSLFKRS